MNLFGSVGLKENTLHRLQNETGSRLKTLRGMLHVGEVKFTPE